MDEASRLIRNYMHTYPTARFGKGQSILRPGDELLKIHYLMEGTVIQYDISEAGNTVVVNSFQPGSFFPLSHIYNSLPLDYFFEAASPVTTRVAPGKKVIDFITTTPTVMHDALARSYRGTDDLLRRSSYAMGGSATSRVMYELLSAASSIGEKSLDGSVFIGLSENDIAKRTGLSRETVNRMLRKFKADKSIIATNQGLHVSSIAILEDALSDQS